MNRMVAVGTLVAGITLLASGLRASKSAASQLSEVFNGRPGRPTILLIAAGLGCIATGTWVLRKPHDKP